ncbi:hypothetical protein [Vagococcus intermedius]|uniref:Uncharacterized protein n=1 Tax=Vagococcus intermedius TaxID=2991418 RepID=A0AAF0CX02_9ENTE|nr:hypothetical protein [Vagococcus intermedius]WEG74442.1 hypothetical protein OL234_10850 [Vagococcus intermedius]WEG76472.1 hypothetical protein OL235_10550 [Vagococcus intermedius]
MTKEETVSLTVHLQEKEYLYYLLYSKYKIISFISGCFFIIIMVYLFILTDLSGIFTFLLSIGATLGFFTIVSIASHLSFKKNI